MALPPTHPLHACMPTRTASYYYRTILYHTKQHDAHCCHNIISCPCYHHHHYHHYHQVARCTQSHRVSTSFLAMSTPVGTAANASPGLWRVGMISGWWVIPGSGLCIASWMWRNTNTGWLLTLWTPRQLQLLLRKLSARYHTRHGYGKTSVLRLRLHSISYLSHYCITNTTQAILTVVFSIQ
jgi:hypothetical protein